MRRRSLLIFLGAISLAQAAFAQDAVYGDTAVNKKTVSLKKYKLDELPLDKVAAIEVLSVQWDTARLGFVQVGMGNRRIEAVPSLPYDQYLQQYIRQQYGEKLTASGVHLLWAVKDVRINERTFQMSEKSFCRLKADAYISRDGQQYALVQAFDTVIVRGGMDVTKRHDENISRALHQLLRTTLEKGLPLLDEQPALQPKDAIKAAQLAALDIPILTDAAYTDGVYASFGEFKANKPSITAFKTIKSRNRFKLYEDNASRTPIENCWGFCAKGELYRVVGDAVIAIEKSGHGFVVSNYLQAARRRNQAMLWSAVGGGMIGSAIAAGAMKPYMVTTIPYITRQHPEATALDMETGELTL
ncbi:hypothetical protein ACFOTA_00135 [Chitinophaga sp. GCM10012297]|uniref:Uncharacterized protein n=1 Tax=Chitinophaga chungangae TaxID=2821488 RepID=A0ABS3Y7F6_9BACT|nr:hypothetical protein [Chitinophaga chungangae]MBO9150597.1 hypothetical protein [Chitinophaga chungangae]